MKKLLFIGLFLVGLTLTGCKVDTPICDDGFTLNPTTNECEQDPIECDDGYVWNEDTESCELDVPTCEDGYVLNEETNECEEVIVENPLETVFENSQGIDNYQMDVTVTENNVTVHMTLLFDGHVSSITIDDTTEYFVKVGDVCTRVTEQLSSVIEETIDCIADDDTRFQFFHSFELDWFEEQGDHYVITEGHYDALNNFFRTSIPGAVVSNFNLFVADEYFSQFTFLINATDSSYVFTIDFANINTTEIEVPSGD